MPDDDAVAQPTENSQALVLATCMVVVNGTAAGQTFPLDQDEMVIGRGPESQIRLDDKPISTRHAKIVWDGGRHHVVDLESTNGTFINGRRLQPYSPTVMVLNDSVQIAETVLAYVPRQQGGREATQQLSMLAPQLPGSATLGLPENLVTRLLQSTAVPEPERQLTLDDYLEKLSKFVALIRRNWVPLVVATVLGAALGNVSTFVKPPFSEASLKLRLNLTTAENPLQREERVSDDEEDRFFETSMQNFMSPVTVSETLTTLFKQKPSADRVMITLSGLRAERASRGVYVATYTHPDPERAVKYLAAHLDKFLELELGRTLQVVQKEVDFLTTQLKQRETELRDTEEKLREFKTKHLGGLPELASGHFQSREALTLRRAELSAEVERTNLEAALARKRLSQETPLLTRKVARSQPFDANLVEVERRLAEARSRGLGDQHPDVLALKRQAEDLKRLSEQARASEATQLEREADPELIQLKNRVGDTEVAAKAAGAQLGAVNAQLERLDKLVKEMPEVEATYAQLTRSYETSKELHGRLFAKLRSSELELELHRASTKARYEVLSPAQSMGVPIRKALFLRTLIGFALGLLIGGTIMAVREIRRYRRSRKAPSAALIRRVSGSEMGLYR